MYDFHIHPDFSIDAEGSIDEYCRAALDKGLQEICFTTHLDSDPEREDCVVRVEGKIVSVFDDSWLIAYENAIREANEQYSKQGLEVRLGVEVDFFEGVEEKLPGKFFDTEFDMIIGSVHLIDHKAITIKEEAEQIYSKYGLKGFVERYFELLLQCVESDMFDIIGHMDIYRRYGMFSYGETMRNRWNAHIDEIIGAMNKYQVGFEINTSWLRRGHSEPMPEESLIKKLIESGIKTVTIGSDAHNPDQVGSYFAEALKILQKNGIDSPCTFRKGKPFCG